MHLMDLMDRLKIARNIAIVVLIAAAVQFLPGGGRAVEAFAAALWVVFAAGFAFLGYRLYRERHVDLYGLGDRYRGLLYGALAVGFATAAAQPRMWQTAFGEFVWFALIGLAVYTLFAVYRYSRTY
jgi:TRAP-type C4-dicarboxylate transport system permease small subunit